ncbi:MAG: MFS transporter [Ktedonobacteraceae bacterium]
MLHSHSDVYVAVRPQLEAQKRRQSTNIPVRIFAACLVSLAMAVHYTDYGPLIPVMLNDLHIAASQAGLMSTLLFLGLAVTYLPGGILVDRYGQRPVLIGGLLLMILGGLLLPLWPNIFWILACRALIGFGSGAAFIAGAGVVAGVEKHAALAQGLYGGVIQIGSGLGLLATPWIAAQVGWQGAFFCWGLVSIPALLAWLFVKDGHETQRESRGNVAAGLRSPAVWSLGLAHMGTFGVGNAIAAWIVVYLVHQYGIPLSLAATFGALGLISGALLRPLGGFLLGRKVFGSVALLRVGTILTCLGVATLALPWRQPVLAIVGMTAIACGATISYTSVFDSAAQLKTVSKGVAQGLLSVIACQTLLWGPPLIGFLFQLTGSFSLPFASILFFCAIAINASILAGPALKLEKRC